MDATLEQLIDQQIELGHKDPHDFYDLLTRALGEELLEVVTPYISDFVAEMSRQRINARRRAQVAKITLANSTNRDIMLHSLWVPSGGDGITYKRISDMTADDFDARAGYLERMASGVLNHAQWCRDCANLIRTQNVATAGGLDTLPQLHGHD